MKYYIRESAYSVSLEKKRTHKQNVLPQVYFLEPWIRWFSIYIIQLRNIQQRISRLEIIKCSEGLNYPIKIIS